MGTFRSLALSISETWSRLTRIRWALLEVDLSDTRLGTVPPLWRYIALSRHYDSLRKLVQYLHSAANDGVISIGLGDHMEPQPNGFSRRSRDVRPKALTSNGVLLPSCLADVSDIGSRGTRR